MEMDVRVIRAGGPGLKSFLSLAVASWRSALGRNLTGVYVHGSLSTGAFNPRTSDIDVVVDHPDADRWAGKRAHPRGPRGDARLGRGSLGRPAGGDVRPGERAGDRPASPGSRSWSCIPMRVQGAAARPRLHDPEADPPPAWDHALRAQDRQDRGAGDQRRAARRCDRQPPRVVAAAARVPGTVPRSALPGIRGAHHVPLALHAGHGRARDEARGGRLGDARSVSRGLACP